MMTEPQTCWINYGTIFQRLARPDYPLALQINCDVAEDEDKRLMGTDGAPLKSVGKLISARMGWDGRIATRIQLSDLRITAGQLQPLAKQLSPGSIYVNELCEAVVESHREDFLGFIKTFEPAAWQQACTVGGQCQFQAQPTPETGPQLKLTLTARFVDRVLRIAQTRKPSEFPHCVQLARYAATLVRFARGRYPITLTKVMPQQNHSSIAQSDPAGADSRWPGDFAVVVSQPDLGVSVSYIRSFRPLLSEKPGLVNWLAEAILAARLNDFEGYVAEIAPGDWKFAALSHRHRCWGLTFYSATGDKPYRIEFTGHVSCISAALNWQMLQAAEEGAQ